MEKKFSNVTIKYKKINLVQLIFFLIIFFVFIFAEYEFVWLSRNISKLFYLLVIACGFLFVFCYFFMMKNASDTYLPFINWVNNQDDIVAEWIDNKLVFNVYNNEKNEIIDLNSFLGKMNTRLIHTNYIRNPIEVTIDCTSKENIKVYVYNKGEKYEDLF